MYVYTEKNTYLRFPPLLLCTIPHTHSLGYHQRRQFPKRTFLAIKLPATAAYTRIIRCAIHNTNSPNSPTLYTHTHTHITLSHGYMRKLRVRNSVQTWIMDPFCLDSVSTPTQSSCTQVIHSRREYIQNSI